MDKPFDPHAIYACRTCGLRFQDLPDATAHNADCKPLTAESAAYARRLLAREGLEHCTDWGTSDVRELLERAWTDGREVGRKEKA